MRSALISLVCGLLFGVGLIASGMTDPGKVKAFLDLAGAWDPSLALVMAAAIGVAAWPFAQARERDRAWSGAPIEWPTAQRIDVRLIGGGVVFGIGWGLSGVCPGPALVAWSAGVDGMAVFVPAMLAGFLLHDLPRRRRP